MHFSHRSYLRHQQDRVVSYIFKELTGNKPPQQLFAAEWRASNRVRIPRWSSTGHSPLAIQAGDFTLARVSSSSSVFLDSEQLARIWIRRWSVSRRVGACHVRKTRRRAVRGEKSARSSLLRDWSHCSNGRETLPSSAFFSFRPASPHLGLSSSICLFKLSSVKVTTCPRRDIGVVTWSRVGRAWSTVSPVQHPTWCGHSIRTKFWKKAKKLKITC